MVVASPQQTVSTAKILPTSIKLAPISAQMIAEVGTTETQVMENVPFVQQAAALVRCLEGVFCAQAANLSLG